MLTSWMAKKKTTSRKKKTNCDKQRRLKVHKKRLVALGMEEKVVAKMNPRKIKDLLKYPVRTARILKAAAEKAKAKAK